MSDATDLATGNELSAGLTRDKEAAAMLSASLVTLTWGVFDAGVGFVAGGTVRLLALRGEDEVVLAEAELDFENRQVTLLERAQLLPGDRLHAEVEWTDAPAPDAEVIGNVTACFGLFRYLTG